MDEEFFGDDLLIVTTNSARGVFRRVAVLIFINAIAAAITLLAIFSPTTNGRETLILLLMGDILALAMSLLIVAMDSRGTWTLDKLGIEHRRPIRPPISLRWSDVARILWFDGFIVLEGKGVRIRVALNLVAKHEAEQIKAWVESQLQCLFDLRPRPRWLDRQGIGLRVYVQRTIVGAVMGALFFGVFLILATYPFRSENYRALAMVIWMPVGMIGCMAPLGFLVGAQNALIDPNYPWRIRRSDEFGKAKPVMTEQDLA